MNRKLLSVCVLVGVGLAIAAFYLLSGRSPEEKRDRYLKGGREYIAQSKVNEAVIMFKDAIIVSTARSSFARLARIHFNPSRITLRRRLLTPIRQKYSTRMQSWSDGVRVADILIAGL